MASSYLLNCPIWLLANLVQPVYQVGAPVNSVTKRPNPVVAPASSGGNCPIWLLANLVQRVYQVLAPETVPFGC
jgi:hypothetical protein